MEFNMSIFIENKKSINVGVVFLLLLLLMPIGISSDMAPVKYADAQMVVLQPAITTAGTPNLQEVTDAGNVTTNDMAIDSGTNAVFTIEAALNMNATLELLEDTLGWRIIGDGVGTNRLVFANHNDDEWFEIRRDTGKTDFNADVDVNGNLAVTSGTLTVGSGGDYTAIDSDGQIMLYGDARVNRITWIPASGLRAPGVKPATIVDIGICNAWEFTDGTDDTICGKISVPNNADITEDSTFTIGWSCPTADPGDDTVQAVWQLEYLLRSPNEDMSAAAETTKTGTFSASTTTDGLVMSTFTGINEAVASDVCFTFRLKRLGAIDSLGDVAHLHGVCMQFVSDKLGEPV